MLNVNYNNSSKPSEDKVHYQNIISYLKWGLSITGLLIAAIATVAIYFAFNSVKEIKEELRLAKDEHNQTVKDLTEQTQHLRDDAKETVNQIRDDSRSAVQSTRDYSENELSRISASTRQVALTETQKELATIFGTDKIQQLIQNQAVAEIKSKVGEIVDDKVKNISRINDAASQMRVGLKSGLKALESYYQTSQSTYDSLMAKNLYDQITADYFRVRSTDSIQGFDKAFDLHPLKMKGNILSDSTDKVVLEKVIRMINREEDLNLVSHFMLWLAKETRINFRPFEYDRINRWYDNLIKK